ncbi:serine/threonine-protein kinase [Actinomycetospora sp. CA-101289]|uniref:serine/threonine-protein kinase n=1 Tax=Actinomycetospora sp. CA-101289 TaxID=3239893 RepID=UPI003D99DFF7
MAGESFGPYELMSLVGRGGMGEVYRAADTRKNRALVALKRLPPGLVDDPDTRRRFLREAELAAQLREPHVIPIHNYGVIEGQPYLDMRLVDGVDLASHLRTTGSLEPARATDLIGQVAAALDAAHREGLVHRDVKPQNVVLNDPGAGTDFVYLIDFGIAAIVQSSRLSSSVVAGTTAYMAPERFAGEGDHRVDVYALGCMFYELLVGRPPFGGDLMQMMWAHTYTAPPRPSDYVPRLPPAVDDVIAAALAKAAEERYASAGALASAARDAVSGLVPRPTGRAEPRPSLGTRGVAESHRPTESSTDSWDRSQDAAARTVIGGGTAAPPPTESEPPSSRLGTWIAVGIIILILVALVAAFSYVVALQQQRSQGLAVTRTAVAESAGPGLAHPN